MVIPNAPLRTLPLIKIPFERIGTDLVGPLERCLQGYCFVLVFVNYATQYLEVVSLCSISACREALFSVISQVGIPKEILTDQGTTIVLGTQHEL